VKKFGRVVITWVMNLHSIARESSAVAKRASATCQRSPFLQPGDRRDDPYLVFLRERSREMKVEDPLGHLDWIREFISYEENTH